MRDRRKRRRAPLGAADMAKSITAVRQKGHYRRGQPSWNANGKHNFAICLKAMPPQPCVALPAASHPAVHRHEPPALPVAIRPLACGHGVTPCSAAESAADQPRSITSRRASIRYLFGRLFRGLGIFGYFQSLKPDPHQCRIQPVGSLTSRRKPRMRAADILVDRACSKLGHTTQLPPYRSQNSPVCLAIRRAVRFV